MTTQNTWSCSCWFSLLYREGNREIHKEIHISVWLGYDSLEARTICLFPAISLKLKTVWPTIYTQYFLTAWLKAYFSSCILNIPKNCETDCLLEYRLWWHMTQPSTCKVLLLIAEVDFGAKLHPNLLHEWNKCLNSSKLFWLWTGNGRSHTSLGCGKIHSNIPGMALSFHKG